MNIKIAQSSLWIELKSSRNASMSTFDRNSGESEGLLPDPLLPEPSRPCGRGLPDPVSRSARLVMYTGLLA